MDKPDGLLFGDTENKATANTFVEEWRRYEFGLAIVESKRWLRPLDRRSTYIGEETTPATQMLRYLRRADDLTNGRLRWGILTNGQIWRLYWQGALSVSEQFFEIDLAAILNVPGYNDGLFALNAAARRHWLKVFALMFRREAFLPDAADERTFHRRALDEGRYYQERVAKNLSGVVFGQVFPDLARAIAGAAPDAPLPEVREAALILLYRLLFILYAEDRDLLPVRDTRYDDYALRDRVRADIGRRKDQADVFSATAPLYWSVIDNLCRAIDGGDASVGLPPYNGGLFDRQRTPLLSDLRLGDAVIADVIDALSFEQTPLGRRYINYRDLGVQQLGSIYERLLEQEIVREGGGIAVRPNIFARKDSGSYYTPDDLVGLIIKETLDPLIEARMSAFEDAAGRLPGDGPDRERALARLRQLDPAERLLELKVCDPAMGSGHFLVNLVDYLSDRTIAAMAEAEAEVKGYVSPLAARIEAIRATILENARTAGWTVDPARLDDRHIVRRMVPQALRLRRGQEPDGGRTGQGRAVAAHFHGRRAALLPRPPSALRRQPVRRPGAQRHRQGGRLRQPAPAARFRGPGGALGAGHAGDRRPDRRRDRRGAALRRDLRAGGGGHRAAQRRPVAGARAGLAEYPGSGRYVRRSGLLCGHAGRSHRNRAGRLPYRHGSSRRRTL